jgi:hypothetical protein
MDFNAYIMDNYGRKTYTVVCLTNWLDDFIVLNECMGLNLVYAKNKHLELFYLICSMVASTLKQLVRQTRGKQLLNYVTSNSCQQICHEIVASHQICVKIARQRSWQF